MPIEYKFANGVIPLDVLNSCAEDDGYEIGTDNDHRHYIKKTCTAWLSTTDVNETKIVTGFTTSFGAKVSHFALWLQAYFHVRIEFDADDYDAFIQACEFQAEARSAQMFATFSCDLLFA